MIIQKQKHLAIIIALIMAITGLAAFTATEDSYAGSTYSFSSSTINADGTRTAKFKCNGMTGLCAQAGAYCTYSGKATLSRMKNTHDAVCCAYYYGYKKGWTSGSNGHKLARLLSYCMGNGTSGEFSTSTMKSLLKTAKKTTVPDGFECYLCKPKGASKQIFIVWRYPSGKLTVTKKSSDTSVSNNGTYTLDGMTIKIYSDAACKNCVKTLKTTKNGKTGGAFSLKAGTYYVKETAVPAVTGYTLNSKVYKIKVPANGSAKVTVSNKPDTGSITVEKITEGEGGTTEGFQFVITNTKTKKSYSVTTDGSGKAEVSNLPFGKYTIVEKLTKEQLAAGYTDKTGKQTRTIAKDSSPNVTVTYKNRIDPPRPDLIIYKETDDDGPVSGFKFKIEYELANSRELTEETLVSAVAPHVSMESDQSLGVWEAVNLAELLEQINADAKAGKTGTYELKLKNTVTTMAPEETPGDVSDDPGDGENGTAGDSAGAGDNDIQSGDPGQEDPAEEPAIEVSDIEVTVKVTLSDAKGTDQKTEASIETGGITIQYSDFTFAGAASKGEMTGTTGEDGVYRAEDVKPGHYVISEVMTDVQSARYRQPESQEVTIEAEDSKAVAFTFTNKAKQIPVKLQKSSTDQKIGGKTFTLSGTVSYSGEAIDEIEVSTGEDGIADFGKLYPGTYVIEETDFDASAYINAYPAEGKENPAFTFTITGDELTEEKIEAGGCLWLGGEMGKGTVSTEQVTFLNIPYVDLPMTKIDGITSSFLPGAVFELKESSGKFAARFRIGEDQDGLASFEKIETNGIITGETFLTGEIEQGAEAEAVLVSNEVQSVSGDAAGAGNGATDPEHPDKDADTQANDALQSGSSDESTGNDPAEDEDADGEVVKNCIVLHGLTPGEKYSLTETEAPKGYSVLAEPYIFSVTVDEKGNQLLNTYKADGSEIDTSAENGVAVIVDYMPEIGTVALDSDTKDHITEADKSAKIIDTCAYKNLTPGKTYTLFAYLMDKTKYLSTGNIDDVKHISAGDSTVMGRKTFTAGSAEGTEAVPIELDASALAGTTTVVYEYLYEGELETMDEVDDEAICEEVDPANENQSIVFPMIGTKAALKGKKQILDQVSYNNLLPGRSYIMYGKLMNADSGKSTGITAKQTFTASENGSGTVTVSFDIDMKQLLEKKIENLVVFEKAVIVSDEGKESRVAFHEDLKDKEQSVKLPVGSITVGDKDTFGSTPKTGDGFKLLQMLILMAAAGTAFALAVLRQRRKSDISDADEESGEE